MKHLIQKLMQVAEMRRRMKDDSFAEQLEVSLNRQEKIAGMFEEKAEEVKAERLEIPKKFGKISRKLKKQHESEIKAMTRERERERRKLKREEARILKNLAFIQDGGTKTTFACFKNMDQNLKNHFSWYERWALNPRSTTLNAGVGAIYAVTLVVALTMFAQISKISDASTPTGIKSTRVALIDAKKDATSTQLSTDSNPQKSVNLGNVAVNFSDQNKTASAEISTSDEKSAETKSVKFTLLQPENIVSTLGTNREEAGNFWQKIRNSYTAKAEDGSGNNPNSESVKEATGVEVIEDSKPSNVSYKVNQGLDLSYDLTLDDGKAKVKETVIIKDKAVLLKNPDYRVQFSMNLSGLTVKGNSDGSYDLMENDNIQAMHIDAPIIWDADKKAGKVSLSIDQERGLATYSIDPSFVENAKYPIYLDPTVTIAASTITNPNSYSKDRTLFEATNGSLISVYSDGSAINYKISTDHGNTWGDAVKILDTTLADDYGFSGWIDGSNFIHLVYSNNGTNSHIFYRKLTFTAASNTITVGDEATVESTGTSQAHPTVAVKSTGTIYVAYRFYDGANYLVNVKSSADGSTWSAATTLSAATNTSAETYPSMTLWNNNPAVIYNFAAGSLRWNYYNGSAWQAAGWTNETISTEVDADTGAEFSVSPSTSDNYLHLAWRGSGTNGILYRRNANGATSWDAASTAITSAHNDRMPSLGLGLSDALYLYYSEYVGADSYNIKYTEKVGDVAFSGTKIAVTSDNANNLISQSAQKASVALTNANVLGLSPLNFVSGTGPYSLNYAPSVKRWTAAADGNFETAENWTPSGAPAAGDIAVFDSTSIKNATVTTFTSGNGIVDQLGGIQVLKGYTGTVTFQKKPSQNVDAFKINVGGDISINGGTVTTEGDPTVVHGGVTDGRGNEFDSYNFIVGTNGNFNADGKGFAPGAGPGYNGAAGASYGGEGQSSDASKVYGDYSNPVSLGSGSSATAGGGAVVLNISNTADISGTVSANGPDSGAANNGMGSGGTINISAATISNVSAAGTIRAMGGNATYNGFYPAYAGAGGRVKLAASAISFNGTISAAGGAHVWGTASAGTILKVIDGGDGDLIIDNGTNTPDSSNMLSAHLKASSDTGSYQFESITFGHYGRLTIDSGQSLALDTGTITGDKNSGMINAGTVTVPNTWTLSTLFADKNGTITDLATKSLIISSTGLLTHFLNSNAETYKLDWTLSNLTVQSGGEINADGKGYAPGYGSGYTSGAAGASYGGQGDGASISKVYGDYSDPVNLGSGGSVTYGGGAILIDVTNTLDILGSVSANGLSSGAAGASMGSGGSINLSAATISNSTGGGTVYAKGGIATYDGWSTAPYGGSGGRIKLAATTLSYSGTISAAGGKHANGLSTGYAAAGTILKKVGSENGDLIIDNTGNSSAATTYTPLSLPLALESLTAQNYGKLKITTASDPANDTLAIDSDMTVGSGSELNLSGDFDGNPASGAWPVVTVGGNASVTGTITANGNGFIHDSGPESGEGLVASGNGSGGGFGGAGGASAGGAVGGQAYGTEVNNSYLGSGGGNTNGGAGGGMVKIGIIGDLALSNSGTISSNGGAGGANGGGGSGGAVQLVVGGTFSGTSGSTVTATGGAGGSSGGGGGGGRISIYSSLDTYTGATSTAGGALGSGAVAGSEGTVFTQHSPSAPSVTSPSADATNQIQQTVFHFNSTDSDTDWLQYKFQLATDSGITENVSTFDQTLAQSSSDGGRSAAFSNQDMTTGKAAGTDGYSSGRDAILTLTTNLQQGQTYYYRIYSYDPEGVDSFDGTKHWSAASAVRSFSVAAIDRISFTTTQQDIVVQSCSAQFMVNLRNSLASDVILTAADGAKTLHATSNSSTGRFYSDGSCQNEIADNNLTIDVGGSNRTFYYKDTTASPVGGYWTLTIAEDPTESWTDGTQSIRLRSAGFGSFEISGAPESVTAGHAFDSPQNDITVTVKDIFGNVKNDWTGQIGFYSSDSQAVFTYNDSDKYTFTTGEGMDNGTHTFAGTGFTFKTKGNQSLVVHNTEGSEYDAVTNVSVVPALIDHFGLSGYPRTTLSQFAMASMPWNTPGYSAAPYSPRVTAYDQYNNIKDDFTGPVWFELYKSVDDPSIPTNSTASFTLENDYTNTYTFTSGDGLDNGAHSFAGSGFIVNTAGSDLRFRVKTTDNGGKYTDFTISVKPQAIDSFGVSVNPDLSMNGNDFEKAVDTQWTEEVDLTAYDAFGNVKTDYGYDASTKSGMIYFYSSDTRAVLPYPKTSSSDSSTCFQFPADGTGTYTFTPENTSENYFKFQSGGYQSLSASECIDPTSDYATNISTNRHDPRLEGTNPLKIAASTGIYPEATDTPSKIFVSEHVPGSTHTAQVHTNDTNDLISASPGHQQVNLSWYNPFDVPSSASVHPQVYVYRCTELDCDNPANFSKIVTDPAEVTATPSTWGEYTDTGLTNGQTYYYRLSYAYQKQDASYLESGFSAIVSATPADIAPREITASQLDITDPDNPGKVKIEYGLRWNSTVSIAYFDPSLNSWHNATVPAMSGDVGSGVTGDESIISHIAYLDPAVDFGGKFLEDSFRIRVRVQVSGNNAYADSDLIDLDSKDPEASLVVDASAGSTANLTISGTDDTSPLTMMVSKYADYAGASWEDYATTKNSFDIADASNVYLKIRDDFNNISEVITPITGAPGNLQIKDASDIISGDYRLTVIWHAVDGSAHYNILRTTDGISYNKIAEATENGFLNMNLSQGTTYGYKVTSVDASGNVSAPAGPVSSAPGSPPAVTAPPQVEIFGWRQDSGVRVRITWHTDQSSDSFVAYSTEPLSEGTSLTTTTGASDKVKVVGSPDLKADHDIMLYNLEPSTKYYFKVLSKNLIQITGYSSVLDFTTSERVLLTLSGLKISDITNSSALVSWTTSKLSTTLLEYGKSTSYEATVNDETMNTDHKFSLKDLNSGEYHLRVHATDSDGNVTISDDYTFEIPAIPSISNVAISEVGDNGATITWETNVPCDSNVDFVSSEKIGGSQGDGTRLPSHKVKLIGLDSKTAYSISTRSSDQFGNVATSGTFSFTTTADTEAPKITNQKSEVSSTGTGDAIKYQLIVSWETDEPATSKVEYASGMGGTYDSASKEDMSLNMTHVVIISDLKANSLYHFRIKSMDKAGNTTYSDDYTVTTPPKVKNIVTIIVNAVFGPINDIYTGLLHKFRK